MNETILYLILILVIAVRIFIRIDEVSAFRKSIIRRVSNTLDAQIKKDLFVKSWWEYHRDYMWSLTQKHSFNKMVYSFKPLKLKYWYTEEEIKIMMGIEVKKTSRKNLNETKDE